MVDLDPKEEYRKVVAQYTQAMEFLELARFQRSQSLCTLIESDFTLAGAVELAVKDEVFYEKLKVLVLEYLGGKADHAA